MIHMREVTLTPADAKDLLARNTHNRPINHRDVVRYADDMRSGRWDFNGESLKFDRNNVLLDGQHRLIALSSLTDVDIALRFVVIEGLDPEAQMSMGQGAKRSLSDQLNLSDIEANKSLAGAVRMFLFWDAGGLFRNTSRVAAEISTSAAMQWAHENPNVLQLFRHATQYQRVPIRNSLLYVIYARIALVAGQQVADEFFARVSDGAGLALGSPVLALRERLHRIRAERIRARDRDLAGLTITAFNHWRRGAYITKLQMPTARGYTLETFPVVTP